MDLCQALHDADGVVVPRQRDCIGRLADVDTKLLCSCQNVLSCGSTPPLHENLILSKQMSDSIKGSNWVFPFYSIYFYQERLRITRKLGI